MKGSIRARLLRGLSANAFGQVTVAVIQFAGVPILLHYWGAQLYGEWLILFAIPAYLSITDLGFSQSAANDMTARLARAERRETLEVFQTLAALVFCAAGAGLLLVSTLVTVSPLDQWLHFTKMSVTETRWVLWLLAAEVLVKLIEGVGHAGFRANGEYPLAATLYSATLLVQNATMWIVAGLGLGPLYAATAYLLVRVAATVLVILVLTRRHPWISFGFAHAHFLLLRRLLGPAFANVAMPFAQALNIQGIVLVIGATLGPLAVVMFSALRTLTRVLVQAVSAICNAVEADFAAAYGATNIALLRSLYLHSIRGGIWLVLGGLAILLPYGDSILIQWTRGKVAMDAALFHWLLLTAIIAVPSQCGLALLKASNRHLPAALLSVATTSSAVAISWLLLHLTNNLPVVGVCLFAMDAIVAVAMLRAAGTLCGIAPASILIQALDPMPLIRQLYAPRHAR